MASATARPIPLPAPVTMAIFPCAPLVSLEFIFCRLCSQLLYSRSEGSDTLRLRWVGSYNPESNYRPQLTQLSVRHGRDTFLRCSRTTLPPREIPRRLRCRMACRGAPWALLPGIARAFRRRAEDSRSSVCPSSQELQYSREFYREHR